MTSPQDLFRKKALEHISSPDQLDELMSVTTYKSWIALGTLLLILASVLLWSIFGSVSTTVSGAGAVIRHGGVLVIESTGSGRINDILVRVGDRVKKDQVVAHVYQGGLEKRVTQAKVNEENARIDQDRKKVAHEAGLISREAFREASEKHQNAEAALRIIETEMENASTVRSPYDGRVLEMRMEPGTFIREGTPLLSLERVDVPLEAILFVPFGGKRIQVGAQVEITTETVKREEYGYLLGSVLSISPQSASKEGMMRYLRNEQLVSQLSKDQAPVILEVFLEEDPHTVSGLRWSSKTGPPFKLNSGLLFSANIVVEKQRPISLLLPTIRKALRL